MRPNIRCAVAMLISTLVPAIALGDMTNNVSGYVRSGETPLALSTVALYLAGDHKGSGEVVLGSDVTDGDGFFSISYTSPTDANAVLYMIADGPSPSVRFATVLGIAPVPDKVTINERTTASENW